MTRGVVYLIYGPKVAERLVVSLWSLRTFWDGEVCVLCSTDEEAAILRPAAIDLDVDLLRIESEKGTHPHWLAKARVPELSPFNETIYIDADTFVTGPIEELFGHPLTLTSHLGWTAGRGKTRKRILRFADLNDPWVDLMIDGQFREDRPAVNGGVLAFQKSNTDLSQWYDLTCRMAGHPLSEQSALQVLTSVLPHRWADERFNRMPGIGKATADVRIWHFYGNRHCRRDSLWLDAFHDALRHNIGGLRDWAGTYDRRVRGLLRGQ